ncbi:MAG: PLDc N-terminal domain-containing protein [Methanosarcinaceae archaeon]|nr:PLDc N-terminal domain-containing protein [Methanosarcinaceae archaeon]
MKRKYILFGGFVIVLLVSLFLLNYNPYNSVLGTQEGESNSTVIELIILGLSMAIFVIYAIIVVAVFGFLIGMFIDCLQRPREKFPSSGEYDKLIWCLGIFFANFIGAVMYYFLVYRKVDWRIADER